MYICTAFYSKCVLNNYHNALKTFLRHPQYAFHILYHMLTHVLMETKWSSCKEYVAFEAVPEIFNYCTYTSLLLSPNDSIFNIENTRLNKIATKNNKPQMDEEVIVLLKAQHYM